MRSWSALIHKRHLYVLKFFVHQTFSQVVQILLNNQFVNLRVFKPVWSLISLKAVGNFSVTKIRDRCFITGTARSYVRLTGLSRHFTKDFIRKGTLTNLTSASW